MFYRALGGFIIVLGEMSDFGDGKQARLYFRFRKCYWAMYPIVRYTFFLNFGVPEVGCVLESD